jgi:hypothetical protein
MGCIFCNYFSDRKICHGNFTGCERGFAPPARLPSDVPEKSEGFPASTPPARYELQSFVAVLPWLAALDQ